MQSSCYHQVLDSPKYDSNLNLFLVVRTMRYNETKSQTRLLRIDTEIYFKLEKYEKNGKKKTYKCKFACKTNFIFK